MGNEPFMSEEERQRHHLALSLRRLASDLLAGKLVVSRYDANNYARDVALAAIIVDPEATSILAIPETHPPGEAKSAARSSRAPAAAAPAPVAPAEHRHDYGDDGKCKTCGAARKRRPRGSSAEAPADTRMTPLLPEARR